MIILSVLLKYGAFCVSFLQKVPVIITGMDKEAFFQMFLVDLIKTIE